MLINNIIENGFINQIHVLSYVHVTGLELSTSYNCPDAIIWVLKDVT
jgi:hypothetical protein